MKENPIVYVISGPNGAGKTTFATRFLPYYAKCTQFVNPDLIANGLSPFSPGSAAMEAGRIMLTHIQRYISARKDFGMETTLSGKSYVRLFKEMKSRGYGIYIFYLWVNRPALAVSRVKERARLGGHDVPTNAIRRRYRKSLENLLKLYGPSADRILFFDNSGQSPILVFEQEQGKTVVHDKEQYKMILGKVTG